jgi:uncharacterized protein
MVLWVLAHDWHMNRARAFLYYIFATGLPVQAFILWLFFRGEMVQAMILSAAALPSVLAGLAVGLYLSRLVPDAVLRRLSVLMLILIAISAIVTPYMLAATR